MSSGFFEIEGGTQPALPSVGNARLFFNTADNTWRVLFPDGSFKIVTLPTPTSAGQAPVWNGTEWVSSNTSFNPKVATEIMEDWAANTAAGVLNWDADTASGGAISTTTNFPISSDLKYGKVRYRVTDSSGSRAGHDRGSPDISITAGHIKILNSNWFSTDFFSNQRTNVFRTGMGTLGSDATADTQNDGVYFKITADSCILICEDGGIKTIVDTGIALNSERWYRFELDIPQAGNLANFKIYETPFIGNEILVVDETITTNIPPASSQVGVFNLLKADAAGINSDNNDVWQDYFYMRIEYPFTR